MAGQFLAARSGLQINRFKQSHLLDNSPVLWVGSHAGGKHAVVKKMDWGRAYEGATSDVRPIFSHTN
jgi:hypothetical protein